MMYMLLGLVCSLRDGGVESLYVLFEILVCREGVIV